MDNFKIFVKFSHPEVNKRLLCFECSYLCFSFPPQVLVVVGGPDLF